MAPHSSPSADHAATVRDDVPSTAVDADRQNRSAAGSLSGCVSVSEPRGGQVVSGEGDVGVVGGVDGLEWSVETALDPQEIRAAGRRALSGGPHDGAVREDLANAGSVSYAVVDPDSLATQMTVVVSWHELGAGRRRVTLSVRGHVVRRTRLLGVLPVGRPEVPAEEPARSFSAALRDGLTRSAG